MKEKVLSVSVAAYNVADYLENTLGSIIGAESVRDCIEVIVVNDGSQDETSRIANEYSEKYPETIVVIDKENGGYGSTINAALAVAKGKYFKLLDGDDWYKTDNLPGFIAFLSSAEADLVISPYYEVTDKETLSDLHHSIPGHAVRISETNNENLFFAMHELAVKTEALREFDTPIGEKCFYTDTEYVFYCFAVADTIARFDQPVYCYRLGVEGQSVSLSGTRKHYRDFPIVARRIFAAYERVLRDNPTGEKKRILDHIVHHYSYNTYKAYMLIENPIAEKETLKSFDAEMKQKYPNAYAIGYRSGLVSVLRKLGFNGYGLISRVTFARFQKYMNGE